MILQIGKNLKDNNLSCFMSYLLCLITYFTPDYPFGGFLAKVFAKLNL